MTACYYCGGRGRGCAECNANSRAGGKVAALLDEIHERTEEELKPKKVGPAPDGSLLMPPSVLGADGTWRLVDYDTFAATAATPVKRHPIKDERRRAPASILEASWEDQVLWLKGVQDEVGKIDSSIRLELLREPGRQYPVLVSRTVFEFEPLERQHRAQWWDLGFLVKTLAKGESGVAHRVAQYWAMRRHMAKQLREQGLRLPPPPPEDD